ncbi:cell wall hydrolase [Bacillus sp. V-88]|nr:hypothetical protein B1B00_08625 [Bacillus sp. DSM 27956]PRX77046.1 cell wall hydrolase [Bacillus sp. V-88]SLK21161.1 Cell Wall Hydrolase [Bacillus sp. V-88]
MKKRMFSVILCFGILFSVHVVSPSKASAAGACLTDKTGLTEFNGLSNVDLLARLVYSEARGESYSGKKAITQLVINRQNKNLSEFGGSSLSGVVLKSPGGFVGMTTSSARCPSTSTQGWQDSLTAASYPGTDIIGYSLWFNTNSLFSQQSRIGSSGYLEYKFPGTSTYKRVMEKHVVDNHTFFRIIGY